MKVVLVVHKFLPRHVGGTEVYTYELAKELSKRHEVYIFCREEGFSEKEFVEQDERHNGLKIRRVYYNLLGWKANPFHLFISTFKNSLIERSFGRLLDEICPDVVHIQHVMDMSAGLITVARQRGIPVVVTLHDYWFMCSNSQLVRPNQQICDGPAWGFRCVDCAGARMGQPLIKLLSPLVACLFLYRALYLKRVVRNVDLFIAPSRFLRDKYIAYGFPKDKLVYLENGINVSRITRYVKERNPSPGKLRFAYIGAIAWQKGLHVLVEAFNMISPDAAELRIYGDPQVFPEYTKQIKDALVNPSVYFMGKIENERVGEVLAETDVLVVPSIWYENSPVVIQEAFAAGVPVLASNLGALAEKVRNGMDGLLFRSRDFNDLFAKIHFLVENPGFIKGLKRNIRPAKSIEENAQALERFYYQLKSQKAQGQKSHRDVH